MCCLLFNYYFYASAQAVNQSATDSQPASQSQAGKAQPATNPANLSGQT